jgi:hypothetical protein
MQEIGNQGGVQVGVFSARARVARTRFMAAAALLAGVSAGSASAHATVVAQGQAIGAAPALLEPLAFELEHEFGGLAPGAHEASESGEFDAGVVDAGLVDGGAPHLRLELGRSLTRAGFALDLSGGRPHSWARVELRGERGERASQLVRLDERGAARVLQLGHTASAPLEAWALVAPPFERPGGPGPLPSRNWMRTPSVQIPSAAGALAQSWAASGGGAPSSPFAASSGGASGLVITEVMKDPTQVSDNAGEWFEVRNLGSVSIDVSGWTIRDAGSNVHVIPAATPLVIPARSYFVFGINADPALNGGVTVGYRYSSFTLSNGADAIQLLDASGALVDAVAYDDGIFWPDAAGKSLSLNRALVDVGLNDDGANWCAALSPMSASSSDFGTPRLANNVCP